MRRNIFVMPAQIHAQDKILRIAWWTLFAIVLGFVVTIRVRLLALPLERDEGEYAYAGQLMLQGIPPYQLTYNMKFPGTDAIYALLMSTFGQSTVGIHLGLLVVNMATVALVFLIGRRLVNSTMGIAAAASYAVLSVSRSVLGFAAHATHFLVLPAVGGGLLLLRQSLPKKIVFASGTLFGFSLLMKQPALFFIPFGAGYLFYRDWREELSWKQILLRNGLFLCGAALPLAATCLLLWRAGLFPKFWFWTVIYAREYGSIISFSEGRHLFAETIAGVVNSGWLLWLLAAFGLILIFWNKKMRVQAPFHLGLLICSGLAVCPGFYFREHYFVLVLPAICLLAGVAIVAAENFFLKFGFPVSTLPLVLFAAASALPLWTQKPFATARDPVSASRMIYDGAPFPEAVRIAQYLREHTDPSDKIAVLGSEPEIYFYSRRHSATGYIYMYGLMEPQKYAGQMQREMIQQIEAAQPKYVVVVKDWFSWLQRENSDKTIFDWFGKYRENLALVGLVNILSPGRTDYYFPPPENLDSIRLSRSYLLIYERKS